MVNFAQNPGFLSGLAMAQGMSPAQAIVEGQKAAAYSQDRARNQAVQKALPALIAKVDINNPTASLGTLMQSGVPLDVAQQVIGIAQKQAQQESLNRQRESIQSMIGGGMGGGELDVTGVSDAQIAAMMGSPETEKMGEMLFKIKQERTKEAKETQKEEEGKARGESIKQNAVSKVDEAMNIMDEDFLDSATGMLSDTLASVKSTSDAAKLRSAIQTIQSALSIDSLIEAKKQGATFGALSDTELALLGAQVADLDPSLGEETLRKNLMRVKSFLDKANGAEQPQGATGEIKFLGFE